MGVGAGFQGEGFDGEGEEGGTQLIMGLFGGIKIPGRPDLENVRKLDLLPIPMMRRMMRYGFAIDVPGCHELSSRMDLEMRDLRRDISNFIPPDRLEDFANKATELEDDPEYRGLNANSAEQLGHLMFNILGIGMGKDLKRTKSGKSLSVDKKQLNMLRFEHPVVPKVLAYKERAKLKSTYSDSFPGLAKFHPRSVGKHTCPVCELHHEVDTWRIHTELVSTRAETGRLASRRPNCFDHRTEVLTETGWKLIKDLLPLDRVAQWDAGKISFVTPTAYFEGKSDNLLWFQNEHIDLCVTPDHRCLLQGRKNGTLRVFNAENYPQDWKQINAGEYDRSDDAPGGLKTSDDDLRMLIAIQADGSWVNGKPVLDFTFKRKRKAVRLKQILNRLGIEFTFRSKNGRFRFYIPRCFHLEGYHHLLGVNRLLPWDLIHVSSRQRRVVLEEIMLWDGTRYKHKARHAGKWNGSYLSKHKHNCDVVATLYSLSGFRACINSYKNNADRWYFRVDITGVDYSLTTNIKRTELRDQFGVYCVSVPSGYLMVRRGGKIVVTGNCQNIPIRSSLGELIRALFVAGHPDYVLVSVDFSQIELRVMAWLAVCLSMILVYENNGDIHEQTCLDCFGLTDKSQIDKIKHRIPAKTANFLTGYGGSGKALYQQLNIAMVTLIAEGKLDRIPEWLTEGWCEAFVENWFGIRPEIREFMDLQAYRVRRYGMAWTTFGRPRLCPEVKSTHSWIRAAGVRQAGNHPVQGTAADIMKIAMAETEEYLLEMLAAGVWCWPLLPVHDQLITECHRDVGDDVLAAKMDKFDNVLVDKDTGENRCRVPIKSDGEIMDRWKKE